MTTVTAPAGDAVPESAEPRAPEPRPLGDATDVRAELRPGTVVVVRDRNTVQVGLAPDRAVSVTAPAGCGPRRLADLLGLLEGGSALSTAATRAAIDPAALPGVAAVLVHLAELGHVRLDTPTPSAVAAPPPVDGVGPPPVDGVAPRRDAARARPAPIRRVHLLGAGQVNQVLRAPLSVNGCRVTFGPSPGLTLDPDRPPWRRRGLDPDLVVLTDAVAVDPVVTTALLRAAQAHLHVYCRDGRVVVGPLVVPGCAPCLRCVDLYRTDCDPQWPRVAAGLLGRAPGAGVPALTAAAALVLAEVAASREADAPLQTVGATVEINPGEGLWRRREWPAHQRCHCGAAATPRPLP